MRKKPAGKKKKPRLSWRKRGLCAVFLGVAALTAGCGGAAASQSQGNTPHGGASASATPHVSPHVSTAAPDAEPRALQVFGLTATRAPLSANPYASDWDAMLTRQAYYLNNPQNAGHYKSFLAQFDRYRGEPLMQMATDVNALVQKKITYTDNTNCTIPNTDAVKCGAINKGADYFWRSPVETALYGEGNCLNQATLQYFIMRYLDVPADRLFITDVNAYGNQTAGSDHTILLVNIAPVGAPPKLVIMNDITPVIPANDALVEKTWRNGPHGPKADYALYDAFNAANSWLTKYTPDDYMPSPAQKHTAAVSPSPKAQVARVNPPAFRRFGRA